MLSHQLPGCTRVSKTLFGKTFIVVDPSSISKHTVAPFDDHEPPLLAHWEKVKREQLVVDAGACFGSYTLPALALGARVVAFEPFDDGFDILCANIAVNDGFARRSTVYKDLLWDGVTPYPPELQRQVFTEHYPTSAVNSKSARTSLDDMFGGFRGVGMKVDWLKLDVEGADLGVLLGGVRMLNRDHPRLIIEDHDGVSDDPSDEVSAYPKRINSSERVHALLHALDYEIEVMRWDVSRRFICAKQRGTEW